MQLLPVVLLCLASASTTLSGQQPVQFPTVGGTELVEADLYGKGNRAVILAHGGQFNKESWKPQAQALADAGLKVLALRFRGDGFNPDGSPGTFGSTADNASDVLAAAAYLRRLGVRSISAVGGSMGGDAVGEAAAQSPPGTFDRIVLLGSTGGDSPGKLSGRKLFLFARDDSNGDGPRRIPILEHYRRAPEPKKLVIVEGSAHAQHLFKTPAGTRVQREITAFLSAP